MSKSRKALLIGLISQVFVFQLLLLEKNFSLLLMEIIYYVFAPGFIVLAYFYQWLYPKAEMLFTPFFWFFVGFLQGEFRIFFLLGWLMNWIYYSSIIYLILTIREKRKLRIN